MEIQGCATPEVITSSQSHSSAASDDDVSNRLALIWQEILGFESIGLDQNYFDLGGDSSLAVQMFAKIEQTFHVKLPLATLYDAPTIEELSRVLRGEVAAAGWSPLVAIQPEGSRPRFFCVHGAGGTVLMYRELSQHLGPDQPFYGFQSIGLNGGCPPLTRVEDMAAAYIKDMRKVQPHGPYFLGGYCLGGTIAFEMAQQLQTQGETVALLALFDTMNWHKIPVNFWTRSSHAVQQWYFHVASFLSLDNAGKSKFFKGKREALRTRIPVWRGKLLAKFDGGSRRRPSDSLVLGKIWSVNDRASWNYIAKPYSGVVTDIRPKKQYHVFSKPDLKWDRLARGQEVIILPAYPAGMLIEPFVEYLAATLRKLIDAASVRCESTVQEEGMAKR